MSDKIANLKVEPNDAVKWDFNGTQISKPFKGDVFAYYVEPLNEVLVLADPDLVGPNNIYIYSSDGSLRLNPPMPKLNSGVNGVYAIWYIPGDLKQETILLTDEFLPYDAGCTFNIRDGLFSDFHPSK